MKNFFITIFLMTIHTLFPVSGWSGSQYILTDLGVPPHALGLAINDFGEIAGNSSSGQFLWAEGEFVYLISGGSGSAHGINNSGVSIKIKLDKPFLMIEPKIKFNLKTLKKIFEV